MPCIWRESRLIYNSQGEAPDLDTEEDWNIAEATLMARSMSESHERQYLELENE